MVSPNAVYGPLARHFAGMALIGVGLVCIDGRLLRRQAASSSTS
jgi:hypothetical protein